MDSAARENSGAEGTGTPESPKRLIIIVPAFNEAEGIANTIASLKELEAAGRENGYELLIYVIDDGSTDDTGSLAQRSGADRVLRHKTNRGLGAAVRTGLTAARSDQASIVVKFDADLQHSPDDIFRIIQPIVDDEAEVVYGDRFGQIEYKMPRMRRIGNYVFTSLMRGLTGWPLRDSQPGIFAIDRTYLEVSHIPGDYNYTQQILLDAYHKGMRFAHVSVAFRARQTGRSFVSLRYPFKVLPQILMVLLMVRPMKVFAPIGLAFLLLGAAVFVVEITQWLLGDVEKPVRSVNLVLGASVFGLQTLFFGALAQLIVATRK